MDPSQELIVLNGEIAQNRQTINVLQHEIKVAATTQKASHTAAKKHLDALRTEMEEVRGRIRTLHAARGRPTVPESQLVNAKQRLDFVARELETTRRGVTVLERVLKDYKDDAQLEILSNFDDGIASDRVARQMLMDGRKGEGPSSVVGALSSMRTIQGKAAMSGSGTGASDTVAVASEIAASDEDLNRFRQGLSGGLFGTTNTFMYHGGGGQHSSPRDFAPGAASLLGGQMSPGRSASPAGSVRAMHH